MALLRNSSYVEELIRTPHSVAFSRDAHVFTYYAQYLILGDRERLGGGAEG